MCHECDANAIKLQQRGQQPQTKSLLFCPYLLNSPSIVRVREKRARPSPNRQMSDRPPCSGLQRTSWHRSCTKQLTWQMRATQWHRQTDRVTASDDRPAAGRTKAGKRRKLDVASRGTQTHSYTGGQARAMWSARRYTSVSTSVDESSKWKMGLN